MSQNIQQNKYFSDRQLADYARDGYLVVPGLYSSEETAELSVWIDELAARKPETGKQMAYYEDSVTEKDRRVLSRIEKFAEYHAGLGRFVAGDKMTGRVAQLLGGPAVLFKEKINFKMPGGQGFTPHQDIQPGWDDYAQFFISVLVAVDENTLENGCLELSPGHHKRGWLGRRMEPLSAEELKGVEFIAYPMKPGDAAFFDCFVPHRSEPNRTARRRRNLYLTYNRASEGDHREKYYADKRKSFPPDFERAPGREYVFRV